MLDASIVHEAAICITSDADCVCAALCSNCAVLHCPQDH